MCIGDGVCVPDGVCLSQVCVGVDRSLWMVLALVEQPVNKAGWLAWLRDWMGGYGCVGVVVWLCGWVDRCMGAWVDRCMGVWVHGCMGAWVHGKNRCMGA